MCVATVCGIGKTEAVARGEREHAVDRGQRNIVTDATIAALAFESQEDGLGEAGERHAVREVLEVSDAEASRGVGEGDAASLDYREIGARPQPRGGVRRTRYVANYRSRRERRFVEDRTARGGRGHDELASGQRSQIRGGCDARARIAFELARLEQPAGGEESHSGSERISRRDGGPAPYNLEAAPAVGCRVAAKADDAGAELPREVYKLSNVLTDASPSAPGHLLRQKRQRQDKAIDRGSRLRADRRRLHHHARREGAGEGAEALEFVRPEPSKIWVRRDDVFEARVVNDKRIVGPGRVGAQMRYEAAHGIFVACGSTSGFVVARDGACGFVIIRRRDV